MTTLTAKECRERAANLDFISLEDCQKNGFRPAMLYRLAIDAATDAAKNEWESKHYTRLAAQLEAKETET